MPGQAAPVPDDIVPPTEAPSYWEMHGWPVSIGLVPGCPYSCAQWSSERPEPFSEVGVVERGKPLTYRAWRDLITACRMEL